MKKIIFVGLMTITLYSCKDTAKKEDGAVTATDSVKTEVKTEPVVTGKWLVVDMKYEGGKSPFKNPEELKAGLVKDSMTFNFLSDGNMSSSSKSTKSQEAKYTKSGNTIEMTIQGANSKEEKRTINILMLTEKELSISMKQGEGTTTFIMQKI